MRRRSRVSLLTAAMLALALLPLCAHPQGSGKDGKQDGGKAPLKDSKGGESKMPAQDKPNGAPAKPMPPTLDKLKTPADAIIILVDKLQEATELIPKAVILAPEKFQELQDRIRALEQQLKGGKSIPNSCKLTGKLEGDYVALRAEFNFATQRPRTPVLLGLQGAHLVEEGDIDKTVPQLDYGDEGFFVRVDKEGSHQLTLNLKVPVSWKRGAGPVSASERTVELGLPGAPATTLSLDMPPAIKEMRVNDGIKKNKTAGHWDLSLGMAKQVTVAWREPQAPSGGGPLLAMDAQIVVKLEEPVPQLHAELVLEDLRGQNKSWRLLLPPGAMATLKTPALPAGAYQWLKPDAKNPWHVLELKDATTERITVSVQAEAASAPVGEGKLPVGPFALADAFRLQGTVLVQATPAGLRGRRLIYHRSGEVAQRELPANSPKADAGFENLAYFQYATSSASGNAAARPPMEIEFKSAAGLAEAQTDHNLRLRGEGTTWFVESTTRIQAKSLVEATDHVDVQLPRRRAAGGFLELASVAPALAFPALMPWPGLAPADARLSWAAPIEIRWEEEGTEMPAADGTRRVRLRWSRQNPKQTTLTLHGKYAVPPGARQVRLDLPRPLGVLDRGGSVNVACGPLVELLAPGLDGPEAVPERQHWQRQADLAPTTVDVAWRPYQPVSPVNAVVDVTIFERSAQVRQHLYFMTPDKSAGSMRLRAPPPIEQVTVEGGKILGDAKPKNELLWVAPSADASGKCDLLLEYDVPLTPPAPADEAAAPAVWNLPLIWPDAIAFARRDAKVRVWLPPGTFSALAPGADDWHERGIESVPERDGLPGLVVRGAGGHLPLTAPVRLSHQAPLAPLVCDRVLIHARVADDGTHFYRARFLVRKVAGGKLTLELPVPVHGPDGNNLQAVRFGADKLEKNLSWHEAGNSSAVVNLPTDMPNVQSQSFLLEVEYRAPGVAGDGRRLLRSVLQPPHWQGEALTGAVRWRVEVPADHVGLLVGSGVSLDYRWMFHGWLLTPQTSVTDADLESWLTGREGGETTPVDIAFSRAGLAQQRIVLLPRQWWLLACSGLVLALGLTFYLVTLRRPVRWILLVLALAGAAAAAWQWPAAAPLVVYGCQPGLLVLLTLLSVQWVWQERYRRQVVVMPGFARRQSGSTLSHPRQPAKPREPSTVDSPPGSAVNTSTPSTL